MKQKFLVYYIYIAIPSTCYYSLRAMLLYFSSMVVKSWGLGDRVQVDTHTAKKWGVRTQGSPTGSPPASFPSGSGQSPAAKRIFGAFWAKIKESGDNKFGHYDQHANFIFRLSGLKGRGHDPMVNASVEYHLKYTIIAQDQLYIKNQRYKLI